MSAQSLAWLLLALPAAARSQALVCGGGTAQAVVDCLEAYSDVWLPAEGWALHFAVPNNRPPGEPVSFRVFYSRLPGTPASAGVEDLRRRNALVWEGQERPLSEDVFRYTAPAAGQGLPGRICARDLVRRVEVACTDRSPALVRTLAGRGSQPLAAPGDRPFDVPEFHDLGAAMMITGPLDGDLSNTTLTLEGGRALVVAESKLGLLARVQAGVGPRRLVLSERDRSVSRRIWFYATQAFGAEKVRAGQGNRFVLALEGLAGLPGPLRLKLRDAGRWRVAGLKRQRGDHGAEVVFGPAQAPNGKMELEVQVDVRGEPSPADAWLPAAICTALAPANARPRLEEIADGTMKAWMAGNDVSMDSDAQKSISSSFAGAGSRLEALWDNSGGQFDSFSTLAATVLRLYCFELRDRAAAGPARRAPSLYRKGFLAAGPSAPPRPAITGDTVAQFSLADFLRDIWARIRMQDAIALIRTAPERLRVSVNGDIGDGVHNITNRFVVLQQGTQQIDARAEDGRGCTCTRAIRTRGAGDPFLCNIDGSARFATSADCRVF